MLLPYLTQTFTVWPVAAADCDGLAADASENAPAPAASIPAVAAPTMTTRAFLAVFSSEIKISPCDCPAHDGVAGGGTCLPARFSDRGSALAHARGLSVA